MSTDVVLQPYTPLLRGAVIDELVTDDGTVVLVGGTAGGKVVRLSPLGHEILAAVANGLTLAELESEMRSRLGEPPGGDLSALVREAVLALLGTTVIVRSEV